MTSHLRCASCGRTDNGDNTIMYKGVKWCTSCAAIKQTVAKGVTYVYVSIPSPGRMYERLKDDPLSAWDDCYSKKPKKRILIKKAKTEIQMAWNQWEEKKSDNDSMFAFYCWLTRYRPYFLTFRCSGDPWQTVHAWLIQYEEQKK
jgi:hypothetical protein